MFTFLSNLTPKARAAAASQSVPQDGDASDRVAYNLMQNAEARAGTDPRQARELRRAACAYLKVVR